MVKGTEIIMKRIIKKGIAFIAAGAITLTAALPAMNIKAEDSAGGEAATQFMDCYLPMPIVEELSTDCWGAPTVGPRDQGNGLEDRDLSDYSYWDGGIIKDDDSGKYYMFASRWDNESGHGGWMHSDAIYATSDNFYGPYTDQGKVWPDDADGSGHNVFPFKLSESDPLYGEYKYAVVTSDAFKNGNAVNGAIHVANSLEGPWKSLGIMQGADGADLYKSNICIIVRPDGRYETINRNGDIWTADTIEGPWTVESEKLWWNVEGMPTSNVEDPVMWYSDGLYHCVANKWDARQAYYLTSEDGLTNWVRHSGIAYTPTETFLTYEDGTENNWTKLERPNVYIEDGKLKAFLFAVIDVQKEDDHGGDAHGSKVIVVPFDGEKLKEFAKTDVYTDPMKYRAGIEPIGDTTIQTWGDEIGWNFGAETFVQVQRNRSQGIFGEGTRPDSGYDCKIALIKYDISEFAEGNIDSAALSLVYDGSFSGGASEDSIQAVLADSDWIEGIGNESENHCSTEGGGVTWENQPALNYDKEDLDNTLASSDVFATDGSPAEVTIDVTKLVRQFKENNPDENVISFALSNTSGNRLHFGSREGGETRVPKLSINTSVSGLTLNPDKLELKVGDHQQITAEVTPADAANKNIIWTSENEEIAEVDSEGNVTAKAVGTTVVKAQTSDGGYTAKCTVSVGEKEINVTGVTVTPDKLELKVDDQQQLSADVAPADAANKKVTWTPKDSSIADVDSTGMVTAKSAGTTMITAKTEDGGFEASCEVTVTEKAPEEIAVTGITIDPAELFLKTGYVEKLKAEVLPADATNKNIEWDSDNKEAAEVDSEGNVTAKAPGTAVVTAKTEDGGFTAECTVTVEEKEPEEVSVTGVTVTPDKLELEAGGQQQITADVAPVEAANKNVTWTSADSNVAEVDNAGMVTAKSAGNTTITVKTQDGGFEAVCEITVNGKIPEEVAVTGITLDPAKLSMKTGNVEKLKAEVLPADAANKNIKWTSENEKTAEVDSEGNVTAKAPGTTVITAETEDGGFKAECTVTVEENAPEIVKVTGVSLTPAELTLNAGESGKLTASVAPENAANKNVTWVSEDSSIAEVDADGNVTAKAAGVTTVTVKTEDGNYTAGCKITVKAKNAGNNNNNNSNNNGNNNSNNNNTVNGDKNKPASNNGTKVSTVKTGDTTSIIFTIVLLAGAAAVGIGCVVIRKRGKNRR